MNTETQDTQSTIYNHSLTHVPLPLLFLPVCGWLISVSTFLDIFSDCGELVMFLCILRNVIYKWRKNPGHWASQKKILQDTRTGFFHVHKNGMNGIPWDKCKLITKSWVPCLLLSIQIQLSNNSSFNAPSRHLTFKNHTTKEGIWFNQQSHYVLSHRQQTGTEMKSLLLGCYTMLCAK